jgi:hypothetical protein
MRDKVHFELKAMDGGIFDGPQTGYPVEMHGGELVTPLNANSMLAEMATTPATKSSYQVDKVAPMANSMLGDLTEMFKTPATMSGYPVERYSSELTTPVNASSILPEINKTPTNTTTDEVTQPITRTNNTSDQVMNMNAEMFAMLSDKLDTMIDVLENGNDTSNKLLKASRV